MLTNLKNKRTQAAIVLVIAAVLVLSGAFAWYTFSQNRINTFNVSPTAPNVNLHDDFAGGPEKDVYVENSGDFNVLVRVKLSELIKRGYDIIIPKNAVDDDDAFGWHVHTPSADGCDVCEFEAHTYFDWTMDGHKFYMPAHNSAKGSDSVEPIAVGDKEAVIDYAALLKDAFTEVYAGDQASLDTALALMNAYLGGDDTVASELTAEIAKIPDTYAVSVKQYADQPESEHLRRLNEVRLTLIPSPIITMHDWINGTTYGTKLLAGDFWVMDSDGWCYWANTLAPNAATGQLLSTVNYKNNYSGEDFTYKINVHLNATSLDGTSLATFFLIAEQNGGVSDDAMILMFLTSGEYIFGEDGGIYQNEGDGFYRKVNKNNGRYVNYTLGEKVYAPPGTLPGGSGGLSVGGQFDLDGDGSMTDGSGYQIKDIAIGNDGVAYYDVGGGVYITTVDESGNPNNSGEKYAIVHTGTDGQTGNDDDIGPVRTEGNYPQWYFIDITDVTDGDVIAAGQKGTLIRANNETEVPIQTFGVEQTVYRVQSIARGENGLLYLKLDEDLYAVALDAYGAPVNLTMSETWGINEGSGEPETVSVPSTYYIIYPGESGKIGTENDTTDIMPSISAQPVSISGVYGDIATTLSVTATGVGTHTYQWYKNGTPVAGAVSSTLAVPDVADSDDYYCTITANVQGHSSASVNTDTVTVSITKRPITITADSDSKEYDGNPLTKNTATVTDGSLADGDSLSVTVSGSKTEVGTADNEITAYTIMRSGTDVTANYNVTTAKGTLTITEQLYSGGSGTLARPYLIGTKADLEYLRTKVHEGGNYSNNKHFKQIAHINLGNELWDPIGTTGVMRFRGMYDGDGYTVSGLNVNRTDNLAAGLFGRTINATIKNIAVKGSVKADGKSHAGGIVGWSESSAITQCAFYGTVESGGTWSVGGIVGATTPSSTISNCFVAYGSVIKHTASGYVAGIVGSLGDDSTAHSNYSLAEISGSYKGGAIGTMTTALTANSNAFLRTAQINSTLEAIYLKGTIETINSCYFSDLNSTLTATNNSTITAANLVALLDAGAEGSGKAWIQYVPGGSWPLPASIRDRSLGDYTPLAEGPEGGGTSGSPYKLGSKADILWLEENMAATTCVLLTGNIDMAGETIEPLATGYRGIFDGGGYTISNLTINGKGLFETIYGGGNVQNLKLTNVMVGGDGRNYVGAIAGANDGVIANCSVSGGKVWGRDYIGGIAGYNGGTVRDCYATCDVDGYESTGGIVGENENVVTRVYYADGAVTGDNDFAGGIIGYNYEGATVNGCVVLSGSVMGSHGFCDNLGMVVGCDDSNEASKCYWTDAASCGMEDYSSVGKSRIAIKATAVDVSNQTWWQTNIGFNFTTVWTWSNGRPVLKPATP